MGKEAENLIAPCGINCGLCVNFLREQKKCHGCRSEDEYKPNHCRKCYYKDCENQKGFCFECDVFPCQRLNAFDKRYIKKYSYSLIRSLNDIKENGAVVHTEKELRQYKCKNCDRLKSIHEQHKCE